MPKFETVDVPFHTFGNRQVLTGLQLVQEPWLKEFVDQFPHCFEAECNRDILIFYPDGDAPNGGMNGPATASNERQGA